VEKKGNGFETTSRARVVLNLGCYVDMENEKGREEMQKGTSLSGDRSKTEGGNMAAGKEKRRVQFGSLTHLEKPKGKTWDLTYALSSNVPQEKKNGVRTAPW